MDANICLSVYDTYDENTPLVGKIIVTGKNNTNTGKRSAKYCPDTQLVHTIIILDVSGSMGSHVNKIVTKYIPDTLFKLGYHPYNDKITLITFSQNSLVYKCSGSEMRQFRNGPEGATYMKPSVDCLKKVMDQSTQKQFRILTISDGDLHDQESTLLAATTLANLIKDKYVIRSSAIRLFTSSQQPDTRGLSSILQLNNVGHTKLVDFQCPSIDEEFVNVFTYALVDDLGMSLQLVAQEPIFKTDPWAEPKNEIYLSEGVNTFWLTKINNQTICLSDGTDLKMIKIIDNGALDFNTFDIVLREKINYYIERLKVLKVVDMTESKREIEQIVDYFSGMEKKMVSMLPNDLDTDDKSINSRLRFLKNQAFRKSKSIIQELSVIANSEKVSLLNSAQQADFLRNAATTANTINLAKRGIKQGLDFDIKAIQEVKEMNKHIHELDCIDDSDHCVSFYSQDTTLSGIRAVCALDDEAGSIDQLTCIDILSLLNIVGVGSSTPCGDYPDPKTYHLTDIMPGVYISMSDLICVKQRSQTLKNPYNQSQGIINAIPFYDDDRIQQFLMKYAPNLLEYNASLGMRNMCVNIPNTYKYVVVGGCWLMAKELQDSQTQINADLFIKFTNTYKTAVNGLFDFVIPLLNDNQVSTKSLYIGNNGVTNMIGPLIELNDPSNKDKLRFMPDILRALFTFEFYQVMRKFYRHDSDGHIKRKQMLDDFLGIDYQKYGSKLPCLFETQKVPEHHSEYHINQQIFDNVCNRINWIDYVSKLSPMFGLALAGNSQQLLEFLKSNDYNHEKALGIDFNLYKFKVYCIFQGLMFDTLASRYDESTRKMTIDDPGNQEIMEETIKKYIKKQYHSYYQSELAKQNKLEAETLTKQMVDQMIETDIIEVFITLFKNGMTRNHCSVGISDIWKPGFTELKDKLSDPLVDCPLRDEKLRILILGSCRDNEVVYNKGNILRMSLRELEELFDKVNCSHMWDEIKDIYIEKNIHLYRGSDLANRHSHNNLKPSYWAYGYKNLREYFNNISKEEQDEYCGIHTHCCGVWDGKPVKWA